MTAQSPFGARRVLALVPLAMISCAPHVALEVAPSVLSSDWSRASPESAAQADPTPSQIPSDLGEALASAELRRLIERALAANADIAVASARIRQARGLLGVARGAMLPVISATAGVSGSRTRPPDTLFDFSRSFGADISFDLDLFGARRAEMRAARSGLRATEFDRDATVLAIQADVARAFVRRAALAARISLLDRNIEQARELERIIRVQMEAGDGTRVDVGLQTIQVRQLQAEQARLSEALDRTRTALAILVAEEAPRFSQAPADLMSLAAPAIEPMQPAILIARRPDIRAAEARIQAAGGDVQAARAAFLPRLRLSASGLGQSAGLAGPLTSVLSFGADLLAPIFDRSRLEGNLEFAAGRQAESVALYRQTLLVSLSEVENALAAIEGSRTREALLIQVVEEARLTARLARLQYLEGDADLQRLFDAEQRLVEAEDARTVALQERLEAAIDLFQAMGGMPAREPQN